MDKELFKTEILALSALDFCREHMFGQDVWLFEQAAAQKIKGTFEAFKLAVSRVVNVSPHNISIVGSARFGFSATPRSGKLLRNFQKGSDLDVVIISEELFRTTWSECLTAYYNGYTHIREKHAREVFSRFLILKDSDDYETKYLRDTAIKMSDMKRVISDNFRIRRPINYRLYETWDAAERYHVAGVEAVAAEIQGNA